MAVSNQVLFSAPMEYLMRNGFTAQEVRASILVHSMNTPLANPQTSMDAAADAEKRYKALLARRQLTQPCPTSPQGAGGNSQ